MKFIPLSFISSILELKRQIINTVVFSDLSAKFPVASLGNYLDGTQYGFTASAKETGEFKLVRITDINDGSVEWNTVPHCDCNTPNNYLLSDNDILVARTGGTTGKSFLVQHAPANAIYASYLIRMRPAENVNPLFIYAFLNSYNYWCQISELKSGSAQPNVNAEKLKKLQIPLCSTEIQKQVVSLIYSQESTVWPDIVSHISNTLDQFDQIKAYELELQTQQSLLAKLRQSILQEAVQGKLTERWREERNELKQAGVSQVAGSNPVGGSSNDYQTPTENPVMPGGTGSSTVRTATQTDETGAELLTRIRAEKAELIRQGKLRKEKPLPPITDAEKPFDIPEGWAWCRLGDVAYIASGSTPKQQNFIKFGIPYLKVYNIVKQNVSFEYKPQYISEHIHNGLLKRSRAYPGDVIMNIVGPPLGKIALIPNSYPEWNFNQAVILMRPSWVLLNKYLYYYLNEITEINSISTKGVAGQDNISVSQTKNIRIPLPPLAEQQVIVTQVEKILAQVSELEAENRQQQAEIGRLMQAVLREAFAGKEVVEE